MRPGGSSTQRPNFNSHTIPKVTRSESAQAPLGRKKASANMTPTFFRPWRDLPLSPTNLGYCLSHSGLETAALVFIRAHRLDHGLGVGVDAPRLEQHLTCRTSTPTPRRDRSAGSPPPLTSLEMRFRKMRADLNHHRRCTRYPNWKTRNDDLCLQRKPQVHSSGNTFSVVGHRCYPYLSFASPPLPPSGVRITPRFHPGIKLCHER